MSHPVSLVPRRATVSLMIAAALFAAFPLHAQERVDMVAINRIKEEGFKRSQIMEVTSWLTDVHGPRLTGSPITKAAGDYAIGKLKEWGVSNVGYESWGPFGRGWVNEHFSGNVVSPVPFPVIGYPHSWTPSTNGRVIADVIISPFVGISPFERPTQAALAQQRGKLRGKILLIVPLPTLKPVFTPLANRLSLDSLGKLQAIQPPPPGAGGAAVAGGAGGRGGSGGGVIATSANTRVSAAELLTFYVDEGVVALLSATATGGMGTVFPFSIGRMRRPTSPTDPPAVSLAAEHYGRMYRILQKGLPVRMELEVRNRFYDETLDAWNIVGEIPGTDKRDEVVIIGAHFDSHSAGTGATDNAAGSAVMMEAMRILKATGVPLRRTVRIALWTGEEQQLLGSTRYVARHFGELDTVTNQLLRKPAYSKVAAYYNLDNGTGAIRGINLERNETLRPIFAEWMKAVDSDSITVRHISWQGVIGTDHVPFTRIGLNGFQFIQDRIEYLTRTHHSSMDVYERIVPQDMMHNAVVVATFAYLTANRDEILPRIPQGPSPAPSRDP